MDEPGVDRAGRPHRAASDAEATTLVRWRLLNLLGRAACTFHCGGPLSRHYVRRDRSHRRSVARLARRRIRAFPGVHDRRRAGAGGPYAVDQALVHLSGGSALGALAATVTAGVFALFAWWVALRPRLVVTAEAVIAVNPWGTQRVAPADVVAVTPGLHGARLHLRTGFWVSSWALADAAGAWPTRGRRVREVAEAIADAQRQASRR
jgi:hypothetical protein